MRTVRFFVFLFLAASGQLSAQDAPRYPMLAVKISPLSMVDPLSSTFAPSLTYRFHPAWAVHLEYGFQSLLLQDSNDSKRRLNPHYWEFRPEIQYYPAFAEDIGAYIALEGFTSQMDYERRNDIIQLNNGDDLRYDQAQVERNASGIILKGGATLLFDKGFILELFAGMGYRHRFIRVYDLVNPTIDTFFRDRRFFPPADTRPGTKHTLQISLGFRLGWVLAWGKQPTVGG